VSKLKVLTLLKRGFLKKCPNCGCSELFSSYIKLLPKCKNKQCKFIFKNYKTEDGPAYFTIFIVGHIILPCVLILESQIPPPPFWFQIVFWPILSLFLGAYLLPRIKGAFLGYQIFIENTST